MSATSDANLSTLEENEPVVVLATDDVDEAEVGETRIVVEPAVVRVAREKRRKDRLPLAIALGGGELLFDLGAVLIVDIGDERDQLGMDLEQMIADLRLPRL